MRIGFVGLGDQGAPIVRRMLAQGADVTVWARRPASAEPLAAEGAKVAASLAELGAVSDVVGVCVLGDDDVRQVVVGDGTNGILAGIKPGAVIAIHSTVAPATVTALEPLAKARGAHLLDAPVSGGSAGALAGTMTVMVGGSDEALALARPVLELFAATIPHLGPVGSAQVLKLLNNNLCYANISLAISALRIAGQLGVDIDRAAEIMRVSSGASRALDLVATPAILARAASPTSAVGKDVRLFLELMEAENLAGSALAEVSATTVEALAGFARER